MSELRLIKMYYFYLFAVYCSIVVHFAVSQSSVFFGDEIVSIFHANSHTFSSLITEKVELTHTTAYYIFLKALLNAVDSHYFARFVHFLIFTLCLFIIYQLGKLIFANKTQKIIFVLPFTFSIYFLKFVGTLRMYSLGILFLAGSAYLLFKYLKSNQQKFLFFSLILDLFGLISVYGYLYWLLIKIGVLLFSFKISEFKQKSIGLIAHALLIITPLAYIAKSLWNNSSSFSTHIDWVKIPDYKDLGLSIVSLFGGGFYLYFEKLASLSSFGKMLGNIFFVLLIIICFHFGKRIPKIWDQRNSKEINKYFEIIFVISLLGLLATFFASVTFNLRLFHIRQLFVIAFIFSLSLGYYLATHYQKNLTKIFIVLFLLFSTSAIRKPLYPPFWSIIKPNQDWALIKKDNLELIFNYCQASSILEAEEVCSKNKIFFNFNELKNSIDTNTFFIIGDFSDEIDQDTVECTKVYDDTLSCTLTQNVIK